MARAMFQQRGLTVHARVLSCELTGYRETTVEALFTDCWSTVVPVATCSTMTSQLTESQSVPHLAFLLLQEPGVATTSFVRHR